MTALTSPFDISVESHEHVCRGVFVSAVLACQMSEQTVDIEEGFRDACL